MDGGKSSPKNPSPSSVAMHRISKRNSLRKQSTGMSPGTGIHIPRKTALRPANQQNDVSEEEVF